MIFNNWLPKLGALTLAFLLWFFVTSDETVITQRTLLVPLTVEGLNENQEAFGVPRSVLVTVSGTSSRMENLRPEAIEATLDLRNIASDFERQVMVETIYNIVGFEPSAIIGRVETRVSETIPVQVALFGLNDADRVLLATPEPEFVTVTGVTQVINTIDVAIAPVDVEEGEVIVRLYAADAAGQPIIENIDLVPAEVRVRVRSEDVLHNRRVPIVPFLPRPAGWQLDLLELSPTDVAVIGSSAALAMLDRLPVTVDLPTAALTPGEYTLEAIPQSPQSVRVLDTVTLRVRLVSTELVE